MATFSEDPKGFAAFFALQARHIYPYMSLPHHPAFAA
jgi:hypothetical protein